eukprot:gene12396-13674_t
MSWKSFKYRPQIAHLLCLSERNYVHTTPVGFCVVLISICSQSGLRNISKLLGFGDGIDIWLAREHKGANGAAVYAINTDFQLGIEMEDVIKGNDKLQENDVVHTPVYSMSYDDKYVIVWEQDRNMFGVVSAVRNHLSCSSCPNSSGCAHVSILTKLEHSLFLPANAERILESIQDNQNTSKIDNQSLLSWQTIPFNNVKAKEIRNMELQLLSKSFGKDKIFLKPIVPGDINCTGCGSEWSHDDPLLSNWIYKENVKLYMDNVYQIKCSNINCRWVLQYDGLDDGLLNMGSYLVFTYNKFKKSWYCYLSLLDIHIDKGFQCEICKEQPSLLIMDATSLSFCKELSHWKSFLQDVQNADSDDVIPRCCKFTDRIMIRDKQCRSLLLRYADSHRRKKKPLSADKFEDLLARIRDESTEIFKLMHFIQTSSTIADHSYAYGQFIVALQRVFGIYSR